MNAYIRELKQKLLNELQVIMKRNFNQPVSVAKNFFDILVKSDLFSWFCQRRYLMPDGYLRWPSIVVNSILSSYWGNQDIYKLDHIQQLSIVITYRFAFNVTYPVYVVDPKLIELIQNTDLPDSIYLPEFVPCSLFVFPENAIKDTSGHSVNYLYVSQGELLPKSDKIVNIEPFRSLNIEDDQTKEKENIYITVVYQGKSAVYANRKKIVNNTLQIHEGGTIKTRTQFTEEDDEFNTYLLKIVVQILLIISNLPELIEREVCISNPKGFIKEQNKKNQTAVWRPNLLKAPRIYEQINLSNSHNKPHHRSPRPHWRRGHWRRVRIGSKNNPQYRWHWFKPTIVNLNKLNVELDQGIETEN